MTTRAVRRPKTLPNITLTTVDDLDKLIRSVDPAAQRVASVDFGGRTAASYQLDATGVGVALFRVRLQSIITGLKELLPAGSMIYTGSEEAVEFMRIIDVHLPNQESPVARVANVATA